jgi:hypothetical protein
LNEQKAVKERGAVPLFLLVTTLPEFVQNPFEKKQANVGRFKKRELCNSRKRGIEIRKGNSADTRLESSMLFCEFKSFGVKRLRIS